MRVTVEVMVLVVKMVEVIVLGFSVVEAEVGPTGLLDVVAVPFP